MCAHRLLDKGRCVMEPRRVARTSYGVYLVAPTRIVATVLASVLTLSACGTSSNSTIKGSGSAVTAAKVWLTAQAQRKYQQGKRFECDDMPVGLNFHVPTDHGEVAAVSGATVIATHGRSWRVATRWSNGQPGPTLTVVQTQGDRFVVCGGD
jgi:hypothetical protein